MPQDSKVAQHCQQTGIIVHLHRLGRLGTGRIFRTLGGHFGFGACEAAIGDLACILKGYRSIALLRKNEDQYLYVGEAKVCDVVHGEAAELVKSGAPQVICRQFELR